MILLTPAGRAASALAAPVRRLLGCPWGHDEAWHRRAEELMRTADEMRTDDEIRTADGARNYGLQHT